IDPNAQVCSPAFNTLSFMGTFFSSGGQSIPYDCYDFHINEPTPEAQIADINTFKSNLSAAGISNPLIYATEAGGWGGCTALPDADEQAYVARIQLLYWSNNVKRHYWYAYSTCALLSNQPTSQTLTPLGIAY